jgi:hypothetical protein
MPQMLQQAVWFGGPAADEEDEGQEVGFAQIDERGRARKRARPLSNFRKIVFPIPTAPTENTPREFGLSLFNRFSLLPRSSQSSVSAPR